MYTALTQHALHCTLITCLCAFLFEEIGGSPRAGAECDSLCLYLQHPKHGAQLCMESISLFQGIPALKGKLKTKGKSYWAEG